MKRIISVTLITVIFIVIAAGCGNAAANSSAPLSGSSEVPQAIEPAAVSEPEDVPSSTSSSYIVEDEPQIDKPSNNDWLFESPENHSVDGKTLEDYHSAIEKVEIYSSVIVKDGVIIDEYYKEGYDENSVFRLASCTKSFSGALIGIAIDKGLISGVDAKLTEFFPTLKDSEDTRKQDITVEHLLTHTSGIYWSEWSGGPMFGQLSRSKNWVDFVLGQSMSSNPGTTFNYSTGGSHLLAAVIQQATGETAYEFGQKYLFEPLGMNSVKWRADPQGITDGGNGISMTARDAAKFGQLYLNGGKWNDLQVIPEEWVSQSTIRQADGSSGTGEYGYSWWLKSFGGSHAYATYYAMGHGGQYIFVVPELKLVTVITGRFSDTYIPQYYFNDYVIQACD